MRCPVCRRPLSAESRFCADCGVQVQGRAADPAQRGVLAAAIVYSGVFASLFVASALLPEDVATTAGDVRTTAVAFGLMIVACGVALLVLGGDALRKSFAGPAGPRDLALGVLVGLCAFAVSFAYASGLRALLGAEGEFDPIEGPWILTFVSFVVLPAFVEEWSDRGVLWVALRRVTGTGGTIFATAILFGMSHGLNGAYLLEVPHRFAVGLLLGWLRARTGSLWPCILAHALLNTIAISL